MDPFIKDSIWEHTSTGDINKTDHTSQFAAFACHQVNSLSAAPQRHLAPARWHHQDGGCPHLSSSRAP